MTTTDVTVTRCTKKGRQVRLALKKVDVPLVCTCRSFVRFFYPVFRALYVSWHSWVFFFFCCSPVLFSREGRVCLLTIWFLFFCVCVCVTFDACFPNFSPTEQPLCTIEGCNVAHLTYMTHETLESATSHTLHITFFLKISERFDKCQDLIKRESTFSN